MSKQSLKSIKGKDVLKALRKPIFSVTKKYGATNIRVFGSFARGEQTGKSDIDLLVKLPATCSLFDLSGLKIDLEEKLNRKVDVLTDNGISPYLRDRILSEALPL